MTLRSRASSARSTAADGGSAQRSLDCPGTSGNGNGSRAPTSRLRARLGRTFLIAILSSLVAMSFAAFTAGSAGAAPLSTIGVIGKCCGEALGEYYYANALDINKTTGDIYLLDPNNSRVLVFDQNGNYKFSFGSEGTGGGQLGKYSSVGISVDQTSGDVYVSESGGPLSNNRITKYSETGDFILTFGRKVNETTLGDVCTKASGDVCQPGSSEGDKAIIFTIAAVDPDTGNVYVPHGGDGTTQIYTPQGKYIESISTPGVVNQVAIFRETIFQVTSKGFKTYTTTGIAQGEVVVPAFNEFTPEGMVPAPGTEKPEETHLYVLMISKATGKWEVGEFNANGKLLIEHAIGMPYPTQGAIAVDPSIPHIYVGTFPNDPFGGPAIILGVPETVPSAVTKPISNLTSNSVTLNGTVNPKGTTLDTFWHFEFRKAGTIPWTAIPQPPVNVGHGNAAVDVSQNVPKLDPNTNYEYRLVASREFGGGTTTSPIAKFKTNFEAPVLSLVAPSHVIDDEATLQGMVDPRNAQATYYFEYGETSAYGSVGPLDEEGDAGYQLGPEGVFERITDLGPSTTYHFRLVATGPGGTTTSGDYEFTTRSVAEMEWPDRDIELVSNPDNGNQAVIRGIYTSSPVSEDGQEILWATPSGAPGSTTGFYPIFLATRNVNSETGWESQPFAVPAEQQVGGGDNAYLPDAVSRDFSTIIFHTTSCFELHGNCDHTFVRMTRDGVHEVLTDTLNQKLSAIAVSDDGQFVDYFNPLTQELIAYHNGTFTPLPTPSCGYTIPDTRQEFANVSLGDLNRTFVQSNGDAEPCESPGVYMVDRATDSVTNIAPDGRFVRTNVNGTKVVYIKESPPGSGEGYNFYEWQDGVGTECLTCGEMPPVELGRGFENYMVSEDLSHIYFWVRSLTESSCTNGSMYVVHGGEVDLVARAWGDVCYGDALLRTTEDGNFFLFPSTRPGTTADNTGVSFNQYGEQVGNSAQLFLYNDITGVTECVSCKGERGPADGGIWGGVLNGSYALSDDGSTVGYSTKATLVPEDINQSVDVYEWHNGRIRLVTDGEVEFADTYLSAPFFWGASTDGRTLVFQAGAELTGNERNHLNNAYAAVVGGPGFPPPNPPAHCTEDSCQGPLQPPPPLDFQGSSAFHGPGSPAPQRGKAKKKHKKGKHKKKAAKNKKHSSRHSTHRHG